MVGNAIANGLYGNGTNLDTTVKAMSGDTITIAGEWFYPGIVYIRLDGAQTVGTVTHDQWQNAVILGTTVASTNGTFQTSVIIPQTEAGDHYIQIEDSQTWMVVTIFVSTATLSVNPNDGSGGATVQFAGTLYPASTQVNVTYLNPNFNSWNYLATTTSDASGNIALNCQMPDLQYALSAGDSNIENQSIGTISFRTEINHIIWGYVSFNEQYRGIKQVGNAIANGLYGNGTNLSSSVSVDSGSSVQISGEGFHPGIVYVRFDGTPVVDTVTASAWQTAQIIGSTAASSSGSFATYVTIPTADAGSHFLSIEDSQTRMIIIINVNGTLSPSPTPTPTPTPTSTGSPSPTPSPSPLLPTPLLTVSCVSTTSSSGFKVVINGNFANAQGIGLQGQSIQISDSINGGTSWQDLTLVNAGADGNFSAEWLPTITGNYLIEATFTGNSAYAGVNTVVSLDIMPLTEANTQTYFSVASNSTVTGLAFNSTSRELSFTVSGPSGSTGYVDTYIAKSLIGDISTLTVYLDSNQLQYTATSQGNSWLIHFTYHHSTHNIVMNLGEPKVQNVSQAPVGAFTIVLIGVAAAAIAIALVIVAARRKNHK